MTKTLSMEKGSGNIFINVGFSPEEAHILLMRSDVMMKVRDYAEKSDATKKKIAKHLRITQPCLSDLLKGKIDKFSLDDLVNIAIRAGMKVKLTVRSCK